MHLIKGHYLTFLKFLAGFFNFVTPVDEAALLLHLAHVNKLNLENTASCEQAFVMVTESLVKDFFFVKVSEELLNL